MIGYDESGVSGNYAVTALALKAGYFVNPTFAIEGKLGFGLGSGSDTETFSGTDVNIEVSLDSYFSLLAVGLVPLTEDFNVYGKVGFSSISLSATGSAGGYTASASDSGSSLSYYFGGEYKIQSDLSLNAEFGSLYSRENVTMSGINFGLTRHF